MRYTIYVPVILITVLTGKGDTVLFYGDKALKNPAVFSKNDDRRMF